MSRAEHSRLVVWRTPRRMLHGLLLAVVTGAVLVQASVAFADQPWLDTSQPPLERANELLAAMTFDQKVSLALNDFGSLSSLGIPQITADDGPSGIRADGTTSFPSAQTLASTFDRRLAWAYGAAIGNEARNKGFNEWLGPAMDIARTPLAGRQPENQGEDPFLAGNQVAEEVAGAKSQDVIATLKHYVGNNQEFQRFGFQTSTPTRGPAVNDLVSERALREIYEAPFQTAIKQGGADAVMCSYNRVNGQQTCESPFVLDPLKSSFPGFVVPDFLFAVRDPLAATLAGMDMPALPGFAGNTRTAAMFTSGQVPPARLDDIVRRVLFALFDSGAFDNPLPSPASNVSTAAHQELATQVAQSGMVLLKNDDRALPLEPRRRGLRSLAVIGPSGEDAKFINGGSAAVPFIPGSETTPLAGITARAGSALQITSAQGSLGDAPLPTLVPSSVLAPSSGTGSGLSASYWSNGDFSGTPALTRVDPTVDLSGAPAGIGAPWSARWTGTLTPTESGLHVFSLTSTGIAQIYLNGKQITSGYREATQFVTGPIYTISAVARLTRGVPVSIRIDYSSKSQMFGPQVHFNWQPPSASQIAAAVAAAKKSDAAVVFANGAQGEGMDRSSLDLPGDQNALIEAVAHANERTIVVLNTGGPVLMPWLHHVAGVIETWYPGQQYGKALAAVLFGDTDPGGRLPVTFPASADQGPAPASEPQHYPGVNGDERYDEGIFVGYRWYDQFGQRPLFPFGYGLSYTRFRFSDLDTKHRGPQVSVSVRVRNLGQQSGWAVPELYVGFPPAAHEPPEQLKGYNKIWLDPGESRRVTFELTPDTLSYFDQSAGHWALAHGQYTVSVGNSSRNLSLSDGFRL